jgi:hypothetical protein
MASSAFSRPRAPLVVDPVLEDAGLVRELVTRNGPYWPVQRYFANAQEMAALSDDASGRRREAAPMSVGPVFRGNWAFERPLIEGIEPFLENPRLIDAACRLFGAAIVRPQIVYANLSLPMRSNDAGHTDVPAFRGVDRTRYPIWLLVTMGRSGLFERWRVRIATAVAWYYGGAGGEFTYWPEGPDRLSITRPASSNTAVVGDNDVMFHRVESIGRSEDRGKLGGMTLEAELGFAPDGSASVIDLGRTLATYRFSEVRVSVSWKAVVFQDSAEARLYDQHADDLKFEHVMDTFRSDLAARGLSLPSSVDPLHDPAFVAALTPAYHVAPTAGVATPLLTS